MLFGCVEPRATNVWTEGLVRLGPDGNARCRRWFAGLPRCNQYVDAPLSRRVGGFGNYSPSTHECSVRKGKGEFAETKNQGLASGVACPGDPHRQLAGGRVPARGTGGVGQRRGQRGGVGNVVAVPATREAQFNDRAVDIEQGQHGNGTCHGGVEDLSSALAAPCGHGRFFIRTTHEPGVGARLSRSLPTRLVKLWSTLP